MKKSLLWMVVLVLSISMVAAFSLYGCKAEEAAAEEEEVAEEEAPAEEEAAAETAPAESVELTMMNLWPRTDVENFSIGIFYEMTDEYEAALPNLKFNIMDLDQADFHVKIQAQAAADDLPDLFFLKGSWVSTFVKNNLVLDLTPYLEKSNPQWKDVYKPSILDAFTRDGKIYGMTLEFCPTSFVYYNEDLWKSIGYDAFPTDWDEIKAAAKKFKENGIIPFALGNKDKWVAESCWLSTVGDRFTGTEWTENIIENNGKAKFTDPDFVVALEFMRDLVQAGLFNEDFNSITEQQMVSLYATGKAATMIDGFWCINGILNEASPETVKATKMTIIPPVPNEKGDPNTISGGGAWALAVNAHLEGAKRDLAVDYVLYITGPEFSKRSAERHGTVGTCNIGEVDMTKYDSISQDYVALVNKVGLVPIYDIQMEAAVIETMNTSLQAMLNGDKSAQQVAEEIQAEQDKLEK